MWSSRCSSSSPILGTVFLDLTILIGVSWHLAYDLICISLMPNDFRHLFVCSFPICTSSLATCLLKSSAHFSIGLLVFLLLCFGSSLYILDTVLYHICDLQIFSSSLWPMFSFLKKFFKEFPGGPVVRSGEASMETSAPCPTEQSY